MNLRFVPIFLLCVRPLLAQEVGTASAEQVKESYQSWATLAVLPGNPFDSRVYSLQRAALTPQFIAGVLRVNTLSNSAWARAFINYRAESLIEVGLLEKDATKAVAVVKAIMDALIQEVEIRRSDDPEYGAMRIQMPPTPVTLNGQPHAVGVLAMDGLQWSKADRQKTSSQVNALIAAISDTEMLRTAVRQGPSGDFMSPDRINAAAAQIRRSLWFGYRNDSWIQVTLTAPDRNFLRRLLDLIPTEKADLTGKLLVRDIDFVPIAMRNNWYMFNCCRTNPN